MKELKEANYQLAVGENNCSNCLDRKNHSLAYLVKCDRWKVDVKSNYICDWYLNPQLKKERFG